MGAEGGEEDQQDGREGRGGGEGVWPGQKSPRTKFINKQTFLEPLLRAQNTSSGQVYEIL